MTLDMLPTEERLYNVFLDGINHTEEELHNCLEDEASSNITLQTWISKLRRKLIPHRLHILRTREGSRNYYRMVRMNNLQEQ